MFVSACSALLIGNCSLQDVMKGDDGLSSSTLLLLLRCFCQRLYLSTTFVVDAGPRLWGEGKKEQADVEID